MLRNNELLPERKGKHMNIKGKVALVTGASRGLGQAIALALGQAGADVALTDILIEGQNHDTEKLGQYSVLAGHFAKQGEVKTQAGAQEIQTMGSRSRAFKMDVADYDEVGRVVRCIETEPDRSISSSTTPRSWIIWASSRSRTRSLAARSQRQPHRRV